MDSFTPEDLPQLTDEMREEMDRQHVVEAEEVPAPKTFAEGIQELQRVIHRLDDSDRLLEIVAAALESHREADVAYSAAATLGNEVWGAIDAARTKAHAVLKFLETLQESVAQAVQP